MGTALEMSVRLRDLNCFSNGTCDTVGCSPIQECNEPATRRHVKGLSLSYLAAVDRSNFDSSLLDAYSRVTTDDESYN